jgi:peptidoglycan/xylan/chitin deacetylase (PgdA/CDA1 family)
MTTSWGTVEARLAASAAAGRPVAVWWRDDDAGRDHPALARLLDLAARHAAPLALAVVPAWLDAGATARILARPRATVIQHGYAHRNHAAAGAKKVELGGDRSARAMLDELRRGRARLEEAFGPRFVPVLAPPWNRIDPALVPHLAAAGYVALSVSGDRGKADLARAAPGLPRIDVHLDPIDWRGGRGFIGEAAALGDLMAALDSGAPAVGVVSHHLAHDEPGWRFLDRLLGLLAGNRGTGVRLAAIGELLPPEPAAAVGVVAS